MNRYVHVINWYVQVMNWYVQLAAVCLLAAFSALPGMMSGPTLARLVAALLLGVQSALAAEKPPKTAHAHWPAGVRTTNLAPHIASVTNCLNNPTTSAACGRLTPGRTTTSADWCARSDEYAAGTIKLHETLIGSEIDVIIIPAADDTEWEEGRAPSWSSNLARALD